MCCCSRATISRERGPTSRRSLTTAPPAPANAALEVLGDAPARLLAVEGEARPRVEVEQHGARRPGGDGVAAVDLQPQRRGRLGAPRGRAGPDRAGTRAASDSCGRRTGTTPACRRAPRVAADPVELHEVALHVRLQHCACVMPRAARPASAACTASAVVAERDVAFLRVVDVAPLDPHRQRAGHDIDAGRRAPVGSPRRRRRLPRGARSSGHDRC